jgi:poly(3-hydroxyalkanoate) synthetase
MLVDWGRPGVEERGLGLGTARTATGAAPLVLGYCMGGLLALALAALRPQDVTGLALLAAPWDFHAGGEAAQARRFAASVLPFWSLFQALGEMPVDAIQAFFARLDPYLAVRKFTAFSALDSTSPKARAFVALEDWLNDGVALPDPLARACIDG